MTGKEKQLNKWLVLVMLSLILVGAMALPYTGITVLFSSISKELDLSLAEIGTVWGLFPLGIAFSSLLGGMLADRFGFHKVITIDCFVIALTNGLRGISGGLVSLSIFMFLCGSAMGLLFPVTPKVAGLFFPPRQLGLAIGISNSGYSVGSILATALGATFLLPLLGSWRNVLFLYSAICVLLGITWFLLTKDAKPTSSTADTDLAKKEISFRKSLGAVLRVKDIWLLALANLGVIGSFVAVLGYLPVYLENIGIPKSTGDTMTSTLWVAGIFGSTILPIISDKIGARKKILIICAGILTLCMYLISISSQAFLWLIIPLIGIVSQTVIALSLALPIEMEKIGPIYGATGIGLLVIGQQLGGFLMPILGGNLAEINQSWPFIFWAIVSLMALLCVFWVKETGHKQKKLG